MIANNASTNNASIIFLYINLKLCFIFKQHSVILLSTRGSRYAVKEVTCGI